MSEGLRGRRMKDENWKEEFKEWKPDLKPFQIKLLEEGAQSNSQTLMLGDMWCEWKDLVLKKKLDDIADDFAIQKPSDEEQTKLVFKHSIDEQFLNFVAPLK